MTNNINNLQDVPSLMHNGIHCLVIAIVAIAVTYWACKLYVAWREAGK